jgi:preprotein translocase subunit SecA
MATVTLQNYFRLYEKLAGMTGTAETEAQEFYKIYKVDTAVIPTNEPVRRIDYDDNIYRSRREKYNAILSEIVRFNEAGLPVLVGTASVEVSEVVSRMLKRQGIKHALLNAKYHQKEAEIVATAGQPGSVTIATNMAGRGTDIKLGPGVVKAPEGHQCAILYNPADSRPMCPYIDQYDCRKEVPCGLQIIGSERHEARRIDRQLRGRSGRQGDPGASRFFLSLEDDLMRLFGSGRIAGVMDRLGIEEGEVIRHSMVTKAIERAQKRVEERNFEIRKHLLEYDDSMNQQREIIYGLRQRALKDPDVRDRIEEMMRDTVQSIVESHTDSDLPPEEWDLVGLKPDLDSTFLVNLALDQALTAARTPSELADWVFHAVQENYRRREEMIGADRLKEFEKVVLLGVIDDKWKDHLREIDDMKEGIGLRAYGGKDPLIEYKNEAYTMFEQMVSEIDRETLKILFRASAREEEEMRRRVRRAPTGVMARHQEATGMGFALPQREGEGVPEGEERPQEKRQPVRVQKVGRNEPCPCGSGKKYKKCCGANR